MLLTDEIRAQADVVIDLKREARTNQWQERYGYPSYHDDILRLQNALPSGAEDARRTERAIERFQRPGVTAFKFASPAQPTRT